MFHELSTQKTATATGNYPLDEGVGYAVSCGDQTARMLGEEGRHMHTRLIG